MFRRCDLNGDGVISADELSEFLVGGGLTKAQSSQLFRAADADHDGLIDFTEFVTWLYSAPEAVTRIAERSSGREYASAQSSSPTKEPSEEEDEEQAERASRTSGGEPEDAEGKASLPADVKPCPNCKRTFNPRSMEIHLRSCGGDHGTSSKSRSALPGATRKQRDAAAALELLLRTSKHDDKLPVKLRATFTKLDLNSNGKLDRSELEVIYQITSIQDPPLDELIARYDANHDGVIQFPEFERLIGWVMSRRR